MSTVALCITPAVALLAFAAAFIHTFRTPANTDEGEAK